MINLPAAEVNYSLVDDTGKVRFAVGHLSAAAALDTARAAAGVVGARLEAMSGCALTTYTISYQTVIGSADGQAGSQRERQLVYIFGTATPDRYVVYSLAGVRDDLADGSGTVDPTQPEVAAFVSAIISGPWCSPFGDEPTELISVLYRFVP